MTGEPDPKQRSIDDIREDLSHYSELTDMIQEEPSVVGSVIAMITGVLLIAMAALCSVESARTSIKIPVMLAMYYPILGLPLGTWLIILGILRLGEQTSKLLKRMKTTLRRFAIRVVIEALNFLYLPIISSVIDLVFPTRETCPVGEFMQYTYDQNSVWAMYVNRSYVCTACANLTELDPLCGSQCAPSDVWRLRVAPGLLFKEEVIFQAGPLILYAFGAAIVGVPILTLYMASRNRDLICEIVIFGNNVREKWDNLLDKIKSTGVYIFGDYEYEFWFWGVVDQIAKVGISIITIFKDRFTDWVVYGLPVIFFIMGFCTWVMGPYRSRFNSVLEGWCYFLLGSFCIMPIVTVHGMVIPDRTMSIAMVGFLLAPIGSLIGCWGYKGNAAGMTDLTWATDDWFDVAKPLAFRHKQIVKRIDGEEKVVGFKLDVNHCCTKEEEEVDREGRETVKITFAQFRCISREVEMQEKRKENHGPCAEDEEDQITEYNPYFGILATKTRKMYKQLDNVIDGATTDLIAGAISIAVRLGCLGFGFFMGSVLVNPHDAGIDCSGDLL
jgi:uncharacterized integral membrane protein